jgi:hypothetical protein
MGPAKRELEVVARSRPSEHDPVKSFVVGKSSDFDETEAFTVHLYRFFQFPDRPSDSEVSLHMQYAACLNSLKFEPRPQPVRAVAPAATR